jgi:hypothetical protein
MLMDRRTIYDGTRAMVITSAIMGWPLIGLVGLFTGIERVTLEEGPSGYEVVVDATMLDALLERVAEPAPAPEPEPAPEADAEPATEPAGDGVGGAPGAPERGERGPQATDGSAPGVADAGEGGTADEAGGGVKTRPASPPKPTSSRCAPADPRIVSTANPNVWSVQRSIIDEYTRSIEAVNKLGYVKRHELEDGGSDGLLLRGVKCGTPLHVAGFRSGDVVHSVNGKEVRNLAGGLLLYAKMRNKDRFEVAITRRGQPMVLTYDVL